MAMNQWFTWLTRLTLYTRLFGIIVSYELTLYTKSACIIIHGTWAQDESWYRPSGDFFKAITSCNCELQLVDEVVSFTWSGKLGYPSQLQAADELVDMIMKYDQVILVAHSHGVTIGMISCENIFKDNTNSGSFARIAKFYALGVPVNESIISPNMHVIHKFYNLFSFGDMVQTVNGSCNRVFSAQDRLINISVQLFDYHPSHSELHHPAIGKNVLKIDDFFAQKKIGNFENFSYNQPGLIYFYPYSFPQYTVQSDQELLLETDQKMHQLMTWALFRSKK